MTTVQSTPRPAPGRGWWVASGLAFVAFVVLTTVVVTTGGSDSFDDWVRQQSLALRSPWAGVLATSLTTLGAFPVVVTVAVAAAALLWRRTHRWTWSALLLGAVVLTAAVVYLLKVAVSRTRPPTGTLIGVASPDYSFPSGHTTDGSLVLVLAATLLALTAGRPLTRRLLPALAIVASLGVGLTRIYLGYHWATDVLGGWLLATSVVCAVTWVALALDRRVPPPSDPTALPVGTTAGALVRHEPSGW